MADRIADKHANSVMLLLDNVKLASYLADGGGLDRETASSSQQHPFDLYSREKGSGAWRKESHGAFAVTGGAASGLASLRESFFSMFQAQAHRKLVDFDDHFDDVTKDFLNPDFATMGKMQLPGQLR